MRCRLSTVCTNYRIGLQAAWVGDLQAACPVSQYPPALQGRCLKKTAKRLLDSRVRGNDDASVPCLPTSSSCTRRPTITNNPIVARTKGRWNDESRSHHTCPTSHLTVNSRERGNPVSFSHANTARHLHPGQPRNGTLYIGATSDLVQRVWQHKTHEVEGFSNRYGVDKLVHFELFEDMLSAIAREKQLKKWNRAWKLELIESQNPTWRDLWDEII